ncbi:serine protease [Haematobacter missouriensis]|uniref:Serine protease n=1 Tax=Haematobacter missouriensis TaxID=366616 RepID=A0A212APH6_9RHOB|nr:trypsin-like peptidase domain-containing protein [Haematobacter missouriensis]KFI27598.1 serine protease [Haematobacter missouriensis]OWJ76024.1 serine protease [Haematobacter missouriensis]OWJ83404.1 serine protease [Haematobacter missouriensis]
MRMIAAPFALLLAVQPLAAQTIPASPAEITMSFAPVVKATTPSVVNIYTQRVVSQRETPFGIDPFFADIFRNFGREVPRVQSSLGSGVILTADGIIVSNFHVVKEASQIRVVLTDRREFDAEVLLADEETDLAVLRLKGASGLPALALRDSDEVEVGELVLAIGNPFGVGQTVSSGIVSGLARSNLGIGGGRGYFIQTDAPINPGNSGGALVDVAGRIIGINTAILSPSGASSGIGFAIPANLVHAVVTQAEAGRTKFERPWAGIAGQAVDAGMAESFGQRAPQGLAILDFAPGSPFAEAGLSRGDVILQLDGVPVNTPAEMIFRMSVRGVGAETEVTYLRQDRQETTRVRLIAPPDTPARDVVTLTGGPFQGYTVANLNPAVTSEMALPDGLAGVVITDVGQETLGLGLRPGDILRNINGTQIATTADLRAANAERASRWQIEYEREGRRALLRFRS